MSTGLEIEAAAGGASGAALLGLHFMTLRVRRWRREVFAQLLTAEEVQLFSGVNKPSHSDYLSCFKQQLVRLRVCTVY